MNETNNPSTGLSEKFTVVASYDAAKIAGMDLATAGEIADIMQHPGARAPFLMAGHRKHMEGPFSRDDWAALETLDFMGREFFGLSVIRAADEKGGTTQMPLIYDMLKGKVLLVGPPDAGKSNESLEYVSADNPDAARQVNQFLATALQQRGNLHRPAEITSRLLQAFAAASDLSIFPGACPSGNGGTTLPANTTVGDVAVAVAKGSVAAKLCFAAGRKI